jgi:hypothetical protein
MRRAPIRLIRAILLSALLTGAVPAAAEPTVAARWNQALLDAVKATRASDVVTARALAVVHTAMFDAWACYDDKAIGTHVGTAWRRPSPERTIANKQAAVSHAAYRTLLDLFPQRADALGQTLRALGHEPATGATDLATPAGIGNRAARHVLDARHHDGANQRGDLRDGAYSDWTGWRPANPPDKVTEPRRFQPPSSVDAQGQRQVRNFGAAHFGLVQPFALDVPWEFRPASAPIQTAGDAEAKRIAREVIEISAGLDDTKKATAEVWALDGGTETPPGYWARLAQFLAEQRGHTLDDDVKLFFALGSTMLDAAIATVDAKVAWNGARPEAFIRTYFAGETFQAWNGAGVGTQTVKGEAFRPYLATSSSPEHISGHSSFGAAGATLLKLFTGGDALGYTVVVPAGSLKLDRGPAQELKLTWDTLDAAADSAGWSRVYGGIHFPTGDRFGRELGAQVARKAWRKAQLYFG